MKKLLKWIAILFGGVVLVLVAVLLIAPMFVDVQQFKPRIEKEVSQATGRPFQMGAIELSLFPWVGVSLAQVRMGSPEGFSTVDFATVEAFNVKVKLFPLIFKDIQVKHVNLKGLRLVLEKRKDGTVNWEFPVAEPTQPAAPEAASAKNDTPAALPIKALNVGRISISESWIVYIDKTQDVKKEIADISLLIKDVSLDRPIMMEAFARLDGSPVSVSGSIGPLGATPGRGTIPMEMQLTGLKQMDVKISGSLSDPMTDMKYNARIQTADFTPKVVVEALGQPFPVVTSDKTALQKVSLQTHVAGSASRVTLSDGILSIDQSTVKFEVKVADFVKPDVAFTIHLDEIDLDRYLPPAEKEDSSPSPKKAPDTSSPLKTDYSALRKIVLDGQLRVDRFKVGGASGQDLLIKVDGKNGLFSLNPLSLALYDGTVTAKGKWDFREKAPQSKIELVGDNIQAGSLLKDMFERDLVTGTAALSAKLNMTGDAPETIKKTLTGSGHISFKDGVIKGIDLQAMVHNVQTAFSDKDAKAGNPPETEFAELQVPFTANRGVIHTERAILVSPVLQVKASGKANLPKETLNFRVIPTLVDVSKKGEKGADKYSKLTVPVLISGSFSSPVFRPDLSGLIEKNVEKYLPKLLDSLNKRSGDKAKESETPDAEKKSPGGDVEKPKADSPEEAIKGLIKGLPFGQ